MARDWLSDEEAPKVAKRRARFLLEAWMLGALMAIIPIIALFRWLDL